MKRESVVTGAGAAGIAVLSSAAEGAVPAVAGTVSTLCTGVCGSCGGGCIAAVGAIAWAGILALRHRHSQKEVTHE